jgi:hypothetical protein
MSKILETLRSESESVESELAAAQERIRLVSDKAELIRKLMAMYQAESETERPADVVSVAPSTEAEVFSEEPAFSPRSDHDPEPVEAAEQPYKATFRGFKGLVATRN